MPNTPNKIEALRVPKGEKFVEYFDQRMPGFGLRVTSDGHRSFFVRKWDKVSGKAKRHTLDSAKYHPDSLDQARKEGRRLLELIADGGDPRREEAERVAAQQRKRANSFAAVAADFIEQKLPEERQGDESERIIRKTLLPEWELLPITEITDDEVARVVKARASKLWQGKKTKTSAKNLLALIKRMFAWAIEQRSYGIKINPAATIRAKPLVGKSVKRDRVLSDDELFALWRAAKRMGYPYGKAYQLLLLSALRLNEVVDASRKELKPKERVWVIPKARMKGRDDDARDHAVPLTKDIAAIFDSLPKTGGTFLFSTDLGAKPTTMSDKVKKNLDMRMLRTLRALAKQRGEDASEAELPRWVNHDIRRSVRSRLSRLKISEEAREAVLAHVRPGIKGTYDWHDYLDEKRETLELWASELRRIVEPTPDNVVKMPTRQTLHH
jgi:hypothetical protein